jgi:hypothetical protein
VNILITASFLFAFLVQIERTKRPCRVHELSRLKIA